MHDACCPCDYFKVAEFLLNNGADVNIRAKDWRTPLHYACRLGHNETAKLLIDNGADVTAKDKDGNTPLDDLKAMHLQKYEELMVWLAEHHPDKALEYMASENSPKKGIGL